MSKCQASHVYTGDTLCQTRKEGKEEGTEEGRRKGKVRRETEKLTGHLLPSPYQCWVMNAPAPRLQSGGKHEPLINKAAHTVLQLAVPLQVLANEVSS